jgi:hypothetical protein
MMNLQISFHLFDRNISRTRIDATDGRSSRLLLDGETPTNSPGFFEGVFELKIYTSDVDRDFMTMERQILNDSAIFIDTVSFIVAAVEAKSPGEGDSYLPGISAMSGGAQTGPQRPCIGSVWIGSGRSALCPERWARTQLQ